MQIDRFFKRLATLRNKNEERGASLVVITVSMVAILSLAAISVDYAIASDSKKQLQNGVDEAALALAQACSKNPASCTPAGLQSDANWYVKKNLGSGNVSQAGIDLSTPGQVTVTATGSQNAGIAQAAGLNGTVSLTSKATATWSSGDIIAADVEMPIMVGYCEWLSNQPGDDGSPGNLYTFYWAGKTVGNDRVANRCTGLPSSPTTKYGAPKNRALWATEGSGWEILGHPSQCKFRATRGNTFDGTAIWFQTTFDTLSNFSETGCKEQAHALEVGQTILVPLFTMTYTHTSFLGIHTYTAHVGSTRIVGFAPFKIERFFQAKPVWWAFNSFPNLADPIMRNDCTFRTVGWLNDVVFDANHRSCFGIEGRFVDVKTPLPNAQYGHSPDGSMGGSGSHAKLTK